MASERVSCWEWNLGMRLGSGIWERGWGVEFGNEAGEWNLGTRPAHKFLTVSLVAPPCCSPGVLGQWPYVTEPSGRHSQDQPWRWAARGRGKTE